MKLIRMSGVILVVMLVFSWCSFSEASSFPYELNVYREIILGAAGLSTIGLSMYLDRYMEIPDEQDINNLDKGDINRFDRSAADNWSENAKSASDILLISSSVSPLLLLVPDITEREWSNFATVLIMYAEAMAINRGITDTVKVLANRKRPYLYNNNISIQKKINKGSGQVKSFYSGHTSIAFCSAVFLSKVYSDIYPGSRTGYLLSGVSLATAATTGYLRYAAGKHYPTDILAGALMGSAVGYLIPFLHEKRNEDITVMALEGEKSGLAVAIRF